METVKMSFHSPTLPETQTRPERAEFTCAQAAASYQIKGSLGNGSGRFQTYSWTPLNLAYGGRTSHLHYTLTHFRSPVVPCAVSLAPWMCRAGALEDGLDPIHC